MFTELERDQVLAHPDLLIKYAGRLKNCTGGQSQSYYRALSNATGSNSCSEVLKGLNTKLADSNKRADKMGWRRDITLSYLADIWLQQKGSCIMTGKVMNFESGSVDVRNHLACSVDRLDSNQGYVKGNIQLLTHWANNTMNTWDKQLFEQMIVSANRILEQRKG